MIREVSKSGRLGAIDGLVALTIVILTVTPPHHLRADLRHLLSLQISMLDAILAVLFIFVWHYCFSLLKLYDKFATIPSRARAIVKGVLTMTVPVTIFLLSLHRSAFSVHNLLVMVAVLCLYEFVRISASVYLLDRMAARDPRRAIIVGSGRRASKAWREIRTRYHSSITLLGFVDDRNPDDMPPDVARRYRGTVAELNDLLLKEVVDLVLIAMPIQSCYPLMQRAVHIAEAVGVPVVHLHDIYSMRLYNGDPNASIFREIAPQQENYLVHLAAKRAVDLLGALVGLIFLSPLFLLIGLGVKLTGGGPVFFFQERYGYRRRLFKMVKFRSMVVNAEELLADLEHANEATGPIFKMRNDPRVTSFGRFLRRTSLDELPQLINVLSGNMSLVGPRPMSVRDVSLFSEATLMRRFSVKPGMTGLWQVNGRSEVTFAEWMAMDHSYIDRWSLLLDLKILYRTISVVFRRSGAM